VLYKRTRRPGLTIQIDANKDLLIKCELKRRPAPRKLVRLIVGRTPATVAIKSQMTPLGKEDIEVVKSTMA